MDEVDIYRNEAGIYGFVKAGEERSLPAVSGPWTYWKRTRFDGVRPLIGASMSSPEISRIIERNGYYLEGPTAKIVTSDL